MRLSTHFSLAELIVTQHRTIDNRPTDLALQNLRLLAEFLEEVRVLLCCPIIISSGYRCPDLNEAVGGSRNSRHMIGLAADFLAPDYGQPINVCRTLADSQLQFDQLILEFNRWTHLGLAEPGIQPRRQVLTILNAESGYTPGLPGVVS